MCEKPYFKVAFTGKMGVGKSTICKWYKDACFNDYGVNYAIFDSDSVCKELVKRDNIKRAIINQFGEESFIDGVYNTKYISNIVFNEPEKLKKLNEIFIIDLVKAYHLFCDEHDFTIFESATIFENGLEYLFDKVINLISEAGDEELYKRINKRSGLTKEEVDKIWSCQLSDEEREELADDSWRIE